MSVVIETTSVGGIAHCLLCIFTPGRTWVELGFENYPSRYKTKHNVTVGRARVENAESTSLKYIVSNPSLLVFSFLHHTNIISKCSNFPFVEWKRYWYEPLANLGRIYTDLQWDDASRTINQQFPTLQTSNTRFGMKSRNPDVEKRTLQLFHNGRGFEEAGWWKASHIIVPLHFGRQRNLSGRSLESLVLMPKG